MKYFLILLVFILSIQSAYSFEYPEKPRINSYSPSKQVIAKKDFLTGKYISLNDPVLRRVIQYETGETPKTLNKYLYKLYLYNYRSHAAYVYKYNRIDAWWTYAPLPQDGSETEDAR